MYDFFRSAQINFVKHKGTRVARVRIWSGTLRCPRVDAAAQNKGYRGTGPRRARAGGCIFAGLLVRDVLMIKVFSRFIKEG